MDEQQLTAEEKAFAQSASKLRYLVEGLLLGGQLLLVHRSAADRRGEGLRAVRIEAALSGRGSVGEQGFHPEAVDVLHDQADTDLDHRNLRGDPGRRGDGAS